jgi:hypothetical protein
MSNTGSNTFEIYVYVKLSPNHGCNNEQKEISILVDDDGNIGGKEDSFIDKFDKWKHPTPI